MVLFGVLSNIVKRDVEYDPFLSLYTFVLQ